MIEVNTKSLLETVGQVASLDRELRSTSLTEYTRGTRIEPLTFIDANFKSLASDVQQNILQTALSIYTAHYLQAVSLKAKVGDVTALSIIEQFATDRNPYIGSSGSDTISDKVSSIRAGLNSLDNFSAGLENRDVNMPANLIVGKVINVPISNGKQKVDITTTVRLLPQVLDTKSLVSFLAHGAKDNSFLGRLRRWRAGELSFADYLLCLDLIEQDKKALINDKNGLYSSVRDRKRKGLIATLLSGKGSVNVASAISIITKQTAKEAEVAMRGKFSNPRTLDRFFEETGGMILMIVDPITESITLYQRGIADSGVYTFDDIEKNGTSANGVDINAVLKAYRLGNSPGL